MSLTELKEKWESKLEEIDYYPETEYGRSVGIQECIWDLKELISQEEPAQ